VAYEIRCDGVTLGFTDLRTGANFRNDPLAHSPSEAAENVVGVHPIDWSPDGQSLLYLIDHQGGGSQFSVGRLWPAVTSAAAEIVPLADYGEWEWASFIDDTHLAVLVRDRGKTQIREVQVPDAGEPVDAGRPLFDVARVDGDVFVWTRSTGALTQVAHDATAAAWARSD
jgi:hypothetical protein